MVGVDVDVELDNLSQEQEGRLRGTCRGSSVWNLFFYKSTERWVKIDWK